jgi:hypothetical protein
MCQINWRLPVYSLDPVNTMAFYPRYFPDPVDGNCDIYNYWNAKNRTTAARHEKSNMREQPKPEQNLASLTMRYLPAPGSVTMFSGAQLHETVPNTTQLASTSGQSASTTSSRAAVRPNLIRAARPRPCATTSGRRICSDCRSIGGLGFCSGQMDGGDPAVRTRTQLLHADTPPNGWRPAKMPMRVARSADVGSLARGGSPRPALPLSCTGRKSCRCGVSGTRGVPA